MPQESLVFSQGHICFQKIDSQRGLKMKIFDLFDILPSKETYLFPFSFVSPKTFANFAVAKVVRL